MGFWGGTSKSFGFRRRGPIGPALDAQLAALLGGTNSFIIDMQKSATFADLAGTDPIEANEAIRRIDDRSGNANNFLQSQAGREPLYRTGPARMELDGTDDFMEVSMTLTNNMTLLVGCRSVDTDGMLASNATRFIGCWQDGVGSSTYSGAGVPTTHIDGGANLASRNAMHDALTDNAYHRVEVRNADLSAWGEFEFARYNNANSTFNIAGDATIAILIDNTGLTAGEQGDALAFAQALVDQRL